MFKQKCAVLIILAMAMFMLPAMAFADDKASKDAILQELSIFADKDPEILRSVIYSMADGYSRENKIDESIALFEKALKVLPSNEDFLSRLGDLYNNKSEFAKAAEIYKKMTELRPDNTWYFQRLSDAYRNTGDKDKAAGVWAALTQKSTNPEVFMQAANFYNNIENMEKAIAMVKKATELAPDNMGYLQSLESFYMRAEKFADAEAVCNKVLAGAKDQWAKDWGNAELINIYLRQNKLDELAAKFEAEITKNAKDLAAYKKLAELYQRGEQRDKAVAVYEKAVAAGVADRDIETRLLDLYEWAGTFDKAEAQAKKLVATLPEGETNYIYERLANIQARSGNIDAAKKTWQDSLNRMPNDAGVYSRYADRLVEWGQADEAITQYKKAQSLDPNNLWHTIRAADILIGKNRVDEAKKELNSVISGAKDDWMKNEAKRRLDDIAVKSGKAKVEAAAKAESGAGAAPPPIIFEEAKKEEPKKKRGWFGR